MEKAVKKGCAMQQIIDGKRYDTELAEKIASAPDEPAKDAGQGTQLPVHSLAKDQRSSLLGDTVKMFFQGKSPGAGDLYRTPKGNWFVHERESNQLIPVTQNEVKGWCEKFQLLEIIRLHLAHDIEDA
jgi:hypothetical protein